MAFNHLKKWGKKLGNFFSRGGGGQQTTAPEQSANETTGNQAAAFTQNPVATSERSLGGRMSDLADRFSYWASGGGKKMNNKKRNWLADGEEGSWRRNKASRLLEKEYTEGLDFIRKRNKADRDEDLLNGLYDGELSEDVFINSIGRMSKENAGNVQDFADKMNAYMLENNIDMGEDYDSYLREATDNLEIVYNQINEQDDRGAFLTAIDTGNGDIKYGHMMIKAKEIFFEEYGDEYFRLNSAEEKKRMITEKTQEIMQQRFGMKADSVKLGGNYRAMLQDKITDALGEMGTLTTEATNTSAARQQELGRRIAQKYQGFRL
ncbi:MAG: hypothetical protein IJN54_05595 [Lachnospiraceae bacterium]|nr:hypothetical protein [Lachnospiraceae bacterium]